MYRYVATTAAIVGASLGFGAVANAADLGPAPAPIYTKAPMVAPTPSWTGFYIGGDVGYGWATSANNTFADPSNVAFPTCSPCISPYTSPTIGLSDSGFLGGAHIGYNWQFAPMWLLGAEGDFMWSDLKQSSNSPLFSTGGTPTQFAVSGSNLNFQTNIDWLASIRARSGFVMNNWLAYATGGVAFASIDFDASATVPPALGFPGVVGSSSSSTTRTGYVVGGGLEWQAPATPWRARLEYLYYAFDGTTSASIPWSLPTGGLATCHVAGPCVANFGSGDVTVQTVRLGVSYAFH
jgi:outer membrane immunogenic protein